MSTAQLYLLCDTSSQPNFQSWAQAISNQLTTAGWTQTSDTGQVNWASTPAVPAAGVYLYEIRQPASDPLQTGGTAYYFKIEYGVKTTGTAVPQVRVSLGTGTNGAGLLTGSVTTAQVIGGTAGGQAGLGAVPYECNFSYDASRFGCLLWRNAPGNNGNTTSFFAIERTKASNGADNSDGVTILVAGGGSSFNIAFQQTIVFGSALPLGTNAVSWAIIMPVPSTGTSWLYSNSAPVCPIFPIYGKFGNPMTVAAVIAPGDVSDGSLTSSTLYGAARTYLASKTIQNLGTAASACALLMRFD